MERVVERIVEKIKIVKEEVFIEVPVPVHVTTGNGKRQPQVDPSRYGSTLPPGVSVFPATVPMPLQGSHARPC